MTQSQPQPAAQSNLPAVPQQQTGQQQYSQAQQQVLMQPVVPPIPVSVLPMGATGTPITQLDAYGIAKLAAQMAATTGQQGAAEAFLQKIQAIAIKAIVEASAELLRSQQELSAKRANLLLQDIRNLPTTQLPDGPTQSGFSKLVNGVQPITTKEYISKDQALMLVANFMLNPAPVA